LRHREAHLNYYTSADNREKTTSHHKTKINLTTMQITKKTVKQKINTIKLKPRLVASYDIWAWKWSGTILEEWEGMKSKKIDEA